MTDSDKLSLLETLLRIHIRTGNVNEPGWIEACGHLSFCQCCRTSWPCETIQAAEAALAASAAAARPASREEIAKAIFEARKSSVAWADCGGHWRQSFYAAADAVLALERSPQPTLSDDEIRAASFVEYPKSYPEHIWSRVDYTKGAKMARDVLSGKVKP